MMPDERKYRELPDGKIEWVNRPSEKARHREMNQNSHPATDMGNAERLRDSHGENLRYCYETGHWLIWNDTVWAKDTGAKIMALAKDTARNILVEASEIEDSSERKQMVDHL